MEAFNFVFSLFSIVLGLALGEAFSGLGKALQSRRKVRIGWLTPLLALIVAFDIISFWTTAWASRESIPPRYFVLMCGLVATGIYYLAARMTFPDEPAEWPDYDAYYFAHKRLILGAILGVNVLNYAAEELAGYDIFATLVDVIAVASLYVSIPIVMWVRGVRLNTLFLMLTASLYPTISLAFMLLTDHG